MRERTCFRFRRDRRRIVWCALWALCQVCILVPFARAADGQLQTYANPLDLPWADPGVLFKDGIYYLTGTTYARYVSRDLIHWRRRGVYLDPAGTWLRGHPWAAELHERDGMYFFYFCSPGEGTGKRRCICVASANSPDEDFRPLAFPMWEDDHSWIDPHVFRDDDGERYLYATRDDIPGTGQSRVWAARLASDMVRLASPLKECLRTSQSWENGVQEGVTVLKHGGTYYMMYSSNGFSSAAYSVGYATATDPLGPWQKADENPILSRTASVSGPGHNGICTSPDGTEQYAIYHCHITRARGGARQLALDKLRFVSRSDGPDALIIDGPSDVPRPLPSGSAPLSVHWGRDDFTSEVLDRSRWVAIWRERPRAWRIRQGALEIDALPGDIHQERSSASNIVLQDAPSSADWRATTEVSLAAGKNGAQAFLIAWQDSEHYVVIKTAFFGKPTFESALELGGVYTPTFRTRPREDRVWLRLEKQGTLYRCLGRSPGGPWQEVGRWGATLQDTKVGVGAMCPGKGTKPPVTARFEFVDLVTRPSD